MPRRVSELIALKRQLPTTRSMQRRGYLLQRIRQLEQERARLRAQQRKSRKLQGS